MQNNLTTANGTDALLWQKAEKHLMPFGIPFSPIIVHKAKGSYLYDVNGKAILDWTSGQMSSTIGHSHPEVVETLTEQGANLDHLLSIMISEPVIELAKSLTSLLPAPLDKAIFLNTGSETTECALKLAKMATGKFEVVAFLGSYHGLTGTAGASTYSAGRKNAGPVIPGVFGFPTPNAYRSPFRKTDGSYDWEAEMDFGWDMIDRQSVGSLAAFIAEPILSTGGIIDLPDGYLKRLQQECQKRNILLIMDEAQTGVGRTGKMWAFEHHDVVPDIVVLSKSLGAGLPLGAVVTSTEISNAACQAGFMWLTTHLNDPLTASIGIKVLEIVCRDNLVQRAAELGKILRKGLIALKEKHNKAIGDVRGRGLLQGIEITGSPDSRLSGDKYGGIVARHAMSLGLSCNIVPLPGLNGVFRIAPVLTSTEEELAEGLDILDKAFQAAAQEV